MATATARHILVKSQEECQKIIDKLKAGEADFETTAAECSACPSGKRGGDLGEFSQGMMVPEFDEVVFNGKLGLHDTPVKTQFGYHVIETTSNDAIEDEGISEQ